MGTHSTPQKTTWWKGVLAANSLLNRLSIRPRLVLCFMSIIFLISFGSIVLLREMLVIRAREERLNNVNQELIEVLRVHIDLLSFSARFRALVVSRDSTRLLQESETLRRGLIDAANQTQTAFSRLPEEIKPNRGELFTLESSQEALPAYLDVIVHLAAAGDWDAALLRLNGQVQPLESFSSGMIRDFARKVEGQRLEAAAAIARAQHRILLTIPLTALVTLIAAAVLAKGATHSITHPLDQLMAGSKSLAQGEFSHRVFVEGEDELAQLGSVFNETAARLQELYTRLRRSEAYLAEAQRLSRTGSFGLDVSSGRIYWSEETFRICGVDPATEPTIDLVLERTHPEDKPLVREVIDEAIRDRKQFDFEHRLVMPDGAVKFVRVVGHPSTKDGSGSLEFVGAVTDITERRRADEALRESESYLAEAQRLSHTGSWVWRTEGVEPLFVSEEWYRIFGFDSADGIPSGQQILQRIHPEDRGKRQLAMDRAIAQRSGYDIELRIVLPDGTLKYIRSVGHPVLDASGKAVQFVGSVTDISERRRAEERLRQSEAYLAEGQKLTKTGSWGCNIATRDLLYSSEEHSRLYGFDPRECPSLQQFYQRIHAEDRERVLAAFQKASRLETDVQVDFRVVLPDGATRYMHEVGHPIFKLSGEAGEFVGITMDVTERKRSEEERERLRQAEADLTHMNRVSTMGQLAASVAHEVKQPIAAAVTDARTCMRWLARDQPELAEAKEAASRAIRDVTRAADIINRIGSLFKKGQPQRELLDINQIIQEMIALFRMEATRHEIQVHAELANDLPQVMADRVQLQQVFMNLMLNGIEAMKDAECGRDLTIRSQQDGSQQLLISVIDTGMGLRPEQLEQIFNAFFTSKSQGTGMGLPISRSIIESHGGRLWAAPNSATGATFQFTLPIDVDLAA